ncbi:MAG: ZIP family metal transporter [Planctomycetota bacterium]
MWPAILLTVYAGLTVFASSVGGWLPGHLRLSHTRMQMIMSFVAGLMLGVALLHMIPHATAELGTLDQVMTATLVGLLTMFFLMRTFHFHHHDQAEQGPAEQLVNHHGHAHRHGHDHGHDHGHGHRYSWVGLFLGLAVHTLIDGVALGASVAAEAEHGLSGLLGLGTFLAVFLHKPLDAMSISSLMIASGWSPARRKWVNFLFASMCPLGALLFWFGVSQFLQQNGNLLGLALAFSAGVFLCISLSDLLPEVHFHSHDRLPLSAALVAGVALAYAVGFLEPHAAHHHHDHPATVAPASEAAE